MFDRDNECILLDEPLDVLKARVGDRINQARWVGTGWDDIDQTLRRKYDDVPPYLQRRFRDMLASLEDVKAFGYQKFDATLAAICKTGLFTAIPGLGKTRSVLMTSLLLQVPTLVVALPRLVRAVWVKELNILGMSDYTVLERPKPSRPKLLPGIKGDAGVLRGYQGIGKVTLRPVARDERTTTDPSAPQRIKIVSYNMLLPGQQVLDYVVCPKCGHRHNREKCPSIRISVLKKKMNDADDSFLNRTAAQFRKGKITQTEVGELIKKRFGATTEFDTSVCGTPLKGALCPECKETGISEPLGSGHREKGHFCRRCGYSARTWVPSITRRLRKAVRMVALDESQAVKSPSAQRSRYALSLKTKYRYLVSGTPATADIATDLYYQLKWLIGPGVMFPYTGFKDFCRALGHNDDATVKTLHSILDPVQIRREADEYGVSGDVDLPPIKERRLSIHMSAAEEANYEAAAHNVLDWYKQHHESATELDLFSQMWILRRAACVPWVDNPDLTESTKVNALKVEVEQYLAHGGKKILIGTEMLAMLDAIEKVIPGCVRIDGNVPIRQADKIIALFQDICPECNVSLADEFGTLVCPSCEKKYETPRVLAVSRMAVREGVTLNKASVAILTDPSWTYADHWQFFKRCHRIGASYDFLDVVYLENPGTIEERMYDVVEARKDLIFRAINRKDIEETEKINIKDFVHQLLSVTINKSAEVYL